MKYFDYAATCPIDDTALKVYNEAAKNYYGNTNSLHDEGTKASTLLEHCRETLADQLRVEKNGIHFTSGGTESNYLGISMLAKAGEGKHLIISQAEHSSLHHAIENLEQEGYEITKLPFTEEGIVDLQALETAMRRDTVLVSIQTMNGEIGTMQPVEDIASICRRWGAFFFSDCVQAFGKVDLKRHTSHFDGFSISSHKIYGPKGVGAVYLSPSVSNSPKFFQGAREQGVRPGTVDLPGIAAFITAAQENINRMKEHQEHIAALKQSFTKGISTLKENVTIIGDTNHNSPIVGLILRGIEGQWAMLEANRKGYAISTGSACTIQNNEPSNTLLAMGYEKEEARTFIRISFSKQTTVADTAGLAACLTEIVTVRHSSSERAKV